MTQRWNVEVKFAGNAEVVKLFGYASIRFLSSGHDDHYGDARLHDGPALLLNSSLIEYAVVEMAE